MWFPLQTFESGYECLTEATPGEQQQLLFTAFIDLTKALHLVSTTGQDPAINELLSKPPELHQVIS